MALLQMGFVLTHGPAPNENVAFKALHGAPNGHDYWMDLHRYFTRRSQDKNLQEEEEEDVNNHLHLIGADYG